MSGRNPPTPYELRIRMAVALERIADALERANDLDPLAALERAMAGDAPTIAQTAQDGRTAATAGDSLLPPDQMWRTR